jgi:hypothetical protein
MSEGKPTILEQGGESAKVVFKNEVVAEMCVDSLFSHYLQTMG